MYFYKKGSCQEPNVIWYTLEYALGLERQGEECINPFYSLNMLSNFSQLILKSGFRDLKLVT